MSISEYYPKTALSFSDTNTAGSGTTTKTFTVPQQSNGITVRLYASAFSNVTADVYVQTSEDGGTTWRDCVHFPQVGAAIPIAKAQFAAIPSVGVVSGSYDPTAYVGSVQASTLAAGRNSGLPLMGQFNRIFISYGGSAGSTTLVCDVYLTGQDSGV